MLREPFVSGGRAIGSNESGYAGHGTYHRVVAVGARDAYGPWGTIGTRIVSSGTRSVAEAPAVEKSRRLPLVDMARFFCAALTVWVHSPENVKMISTLKYGRVAMEYFTLLAVFFMVRWAFRHSNSSWKDYAGERLRRLYVPFLAWTLIYYSLDFVRHFAVEGVITPLDPNFWFDCTHYHLWFIPFIVAGCVGLFPVVKWATNRPRMITPLIILLAIAGLVISLLPIKDPTYGVVSTYTSIIKHWGTVTCLFWGTAAAFLYQKVKHHPLLGRYTLAIGGVLLVCGLVINGQLGGKIPFLQAIGGLGLLLVTLTPVKAGRVMEFMAKCGPYALGIYLSHFVFTRSLQFLNASVLHFGAAWWYDLIVLATALGLSIVTVMLLARSPATRWLIASDSPDKAKSAAKPRLRLQPEMAAAA